jgi:hypothetical protein
MGTGIKNDKRHKIWTGSGFVKFKRLSKGFAAHK